MQGFGELGHAFPFARDIFAVAAQLIVGTARRAHSPLRCPSLKISGTAHERSGCFT